MLLLSALALVAVTLRRVWLPLESGHFMIDDHDYLGGRAGTEIIDGHRVNMGAIALEPGVMGPISFEEGSRFSNQAVQIMKADYETLTFVPVGE